MAKEVKWESLFPRMQYTVYQAIDAYRRSIAPSLKTKQGVAILPESGLPCYAAPRIKTDSMDVHAETSALVKMLTVMGSNSKWITMALVSSEKDVWPCKSCLHKLWEFKDSKFSTIYSVQVGGSSILHLKHKILWDFFD